MAAYKAYGSDLTTIALKLKEQYVYGSSRLGVINRDMDVDQPRLTPDNGNANLGTAYLATFTRGGKLFEFTNHLGNVLFTATDAKVPKAQTGNPSLIGSYSVNMVTATDYSPFGMILQGMNYNSAAATKYRYGFNGKELDNETKGSGNQYDYGERAYDPRTGRFNSVDRLTASYPWYTPYQFSGNNPILNIDLDGLEEHPYFLLPQWAKNAYQFFDGLSAAAKSLAHDLAPIRIADENDPKNLGEWWNGVKTIPSNLSQLPSEFKRVYTEGSIKDKTELTTKTAGMVFALIKGKPTQSNIGMTSYGFNQALKKAGVISGEMGVIFKKARAAAAGDISAASEIRVAKLLRDENKNVHFIDADLGHKAGTGTFDFFADGIKTDVKRIQGLGRNAVSDVAGGVEQVGPGGQVIVVRPADSKFTLKQYEESLIKNFKPKKEGVTVRVVEESSLPKL